MGKSSSRHIGVGFVNPFPKDFSGKFEERTESLAPSLYLTVRFFGQPIKRREAEHAGSRYRFKSFLKNNSKLFLFFEGQVLTSHQNQ
jgi:hypothetical protein